MMEKLIITAAICGAEVTKENSPAIPYTVEEMVREAKSAFEAGAAVIHVHVREDDGTPTQDRERFRVVLDAIKEACPGVILIPSTGGAVGMTAEERLQPTELFPEMATLDTVVNMANKGEVPGAPMQFNFVLGVSGCTPATVGNLDYLVKQIPTGSPWTVTGVGRGAWPMVAAGIVMGGNVRVGFEDNIYLEKGHKAASNGELVEKVVRLAKELGREIATPDEARKILSLA